MTNKKRIFFANATTTRLRRGLKASEDGIKLYRKLIDKELAFGDLMDTDNIADYCESLKRHYENKREIESILEERSKEEAIS